MTSNPQTKTNLITPAGYQRLAAEARKLWEEERPKVVEEVRQAAAQGDRSENAEYIYGKRRLREIDRRLGFLNRRLDMAKVIDPLIQKSERIDFGAYVIVETEEGEQKQYQIVGEDEAAPSSGLISWKSPVGKALMNKKIDDYIEIETPKGVIELTIVDFHFGKKNA